MKKIIALLLVASTFLISCSKTDEPLTINPSSETDGPVTVDPSSNVLVKKMVTVVTTKSNNLSNTTTRNLTYNGNKLVSVISDSPDSGNVNFSYTGDLITKREIVFSGNLAFSTIYTYNSSNNLVSVLTVNAFNSTIENKKEYTYNSDGTVSFISKETDTKTKITTTKNTGKLFFDNGNLTKIEETEGSSTKVTTFEYDTKRRWQNNITGFNKMIDDATTFSVNTVVKSTKITTYNNQPSTSDIKSYLVSYDNANFVTKSVYEDNDSKEIITYTY
jgi:hypothetical protein